MSVREKPVASRYLDLKEKEKSYRKHINAVVTARATINTTQPDTPPRLQVAAVNNARHRQNLKRDYESNMRKIMEVEQERPQTTKSMRRPPPSRDSYSSTRTPQKRGRTPRDIDIFDDLTRDPLKQRYSSNRYMDSSSNAHNYTFESTSSEIPMSSDIPSSASSSMKPSPYITEPPKEHKKSTVDSIKIGFSPAAIVESIEVDDSTTDADPATANSKNTIDFDAIEQGITTLTKENLENSFSDSN